MGGSWFPHESSLQVFITATEVQDTWWTSHRVCSQYKPSQCVARRSHTGAPCIARMEKSRDVYCACTTGQLLCLWPESLSLLLSLSDQVFEKGPRACRQPSTAAGIYSRAPPILLPAPQQSIARNIKDTGPSCPEARGHFCPQQESAGGHVC